MAVEDRTSPVEETSGAVARTLRVVAAHVHDPERVVLRRAGRAAIVSPLLFAVFLAALDDRNAATFATFGSFALLAMVDFGGPLRRRLGAYLVTTAVGAGLVVAGTAFSHTVVGAALAMAAVAFVANLLAVLGGYYAAAVPAVVLSFLLAVAAPAPAGAVGGRLLGWCVAGVAAGLAAVVLWPVQERRRLAEGMAVAADELAGLLDAAASGTGPAAVAPLDQRAGDAVDRVTSTFWSSPLRPSGPSRHDRAFVFALGELRWVLELARLVLAEGTPAPADAALLRTSAASLRASAVTLRGGARSPVAAVEQARDAHLVAVTGWVTSALRSGTDPDAVVARLRRSFAVRVASYAGLSLAANVDIARGATIDRRRASASLAMPTSGAGRPSQRLRATLQLQLQPRGVWVRNAVRVGVALGIAVAVAQAGDLPNSFWVALGALTALRSNALGTGFTVVQALVGTVVGFGLAAGLVELASGRWALWALLPVTVFLAAYTPTAVHFVVGQASFTVLVVVLFNLIEPTGWRVGLVRVQDVAVGLMVSVVVSVVFWPRGASIELRRTASSALAASGRYFAGAVARWLGRGSAPDLLHLQASASGLQAQETYGVFLGERGRRRISAELAGRLVGASAVVRLAAEAVDGISEGGTGAGSCQDLADLLTSEANDLGTCLATLGGGDEQLQAEHLEQLARRDEAKVAACLAATSDGEDARATLRLAWVSAWLRHLWDLARRTEVSAAEAARAVGRPWWA